MSLREEGEKKKKQTSKLLLYIRKKGRNYE